MPDQASNEEIVRRYSEASLLGDLDEQEALRHPEWTVAWPQSGELVRGNRNNRNIMENYPGGAPEVLEIQRIVGDRDQWVVSAGNTIMRVVGSGDFWWTESRMRYPDGAIYEAITLYELRDGRVWRETAYWAEPFEAPAWRAQWVERIGRPVGS